MVSQGTVQTERRQIVEELIAQLGITLSPEQAAVFWNPARVSVCAGGEGSGKTFLGALKAVTFTHADALLEARQDIFKQRLVWVVGQDNETTRQCTDGGVDSILGFCERLGTFDVKLKSIPASKDSKAVVPATLRRWGYPAKVVYESISAYDYTKIGREEPDAIIGEECSTWPYEVWERCYGRLARKAFLNPPAWGYFSGSFESSIGWFPEIWQLGQAPNERDIASASMPSWANPTRYPGGRNDPAILQLEASMTPERFMERHGGKPAPPRDAVFPEFKNLLHVASVVPHPSLPVYVFIDPGDKVYACLLVQVVEQEIRVLNELYAHHYTHEQVIQALQLMAEWKHVRHGVMDVAGTQVHGGLGTPLEAWRRDTGLPIATRFVKVADSIDRLRSVLAINPVTLRPFLQVHPRCHGLIAEMGGGPSPAPGGGLWRHRFGVPEAKNDHSSKALAYGLVTLFGTARPLAVPPSDWQSLRGEEYDADVSSYLVPLKGRQRVTA